MMRSRTRALAIAALISFGFVCAAILVWAISSNVTANARRRLEFARATQACAEHRLPEGTVVYDQTVEGIRQLTGESGYGLTVDGRAVAYRSEHWDQVAGQTFGPYVATVFLHRVVAARGPAIIVHLVIDEVSAKPAPYRAQTVRFRLMRATLTADPPSIVPVFNPLPPLVSIRAHESSTIRVLAAQPDAQDLSRFSFRYLVDGTAYDVNWQVQGDGTFTVTCDFPGTRLEPNGLVVMEHYIGLDPPETQKAPATRGVPAPRGGRTEAE